MAVRGEMRGPRVPIGLDSSIGVVAIDEQKVDRSAPSTSCGSAELLDPNDAATPDRRDQTVRDESRWAERSEAAEVIRVNQVQAAVGCHNLAHLPGGSAFGNSKLDDYLAPGGILAEQLTFGFGVLGCRWSKSNKPKYGSSEARAVYSVFGCSHGEEPNVRVSCPGDGRCAIFRFVGSVTRPHCVPRVRTSIRPWMPTSGTPMNAPVIQLPMCVGPLEPMPPARLELATPGLGSVGAEYR